MALVDAIGESFGIDSKESAQVYFNGLQTKFICDSLYKHPVYHISIRKYINHCNYTVQPLNGSQVRVEDPVAMLLWPGV